MRRIGLAVVLALGCFLASFVAEAQGPAKVWRIGFLSPSGNKGAGFAVFREGLRELGYVEGQNIAFEFRSSEGKHGRLPLRGRHIVLLDRRRRGRVAGGKLTGDR